MALSNNLLVIMESNAKENEDNACVTSKVNERGDLQWVMVTINDVSLYLLFCNIIDFLFDEF